MNAVTVGVLVMAYGGPDTLDDVGPYLLDVRGGRETPPAMVEEIRERYAKIGGRSPILERTRAQAAALDAALNGGGARFTVAVGMRHWHPYIRDTLADLAARGVRRVVGLAMAPHYSRMSIGAYERAAAESRGDIDLRTIRSWHLLPGYIGALADRVREARARFPAADRAAVPVIYTAHSLPERILAWNDPYPEELAATVRAVSEVLGPHPHDFAYQSAAMTRDPWLGPDVGDVLDALADAGTPGVIVAPVGFVCEHVEILYDLDVELAARAAARGVRLERIAMLNDEPRLMEGLAGLVRDTAREAGWM
jgi:protoporphyrin/coproporphyrin ferrochelatase